MKRLYLLGLAAVGAYVVLLVLPALEQHSGSGMVIGEPFPELELFDPAGQGLQIPPVSRVTVLNIWATWCAPCRKELPMLQDVARKWDVEVILANEEIGSRGRVAAFLQDRGISLPLVFLEPQDSRRLGGVPVVPMTYVIDKQGRLVARFSGLVSQAELGAVLADLTVKHASLKQKQADADQG